MKTILTALLLIIAIPLNTTAALTSNSHATVLNGSNQYWSISDASQSGLDITGDLTICLWIKYTSYGSATAYVPVGKINFNDTGTARTYAIEQNITGSNKFDFEAANGTGNVRKGVAFTPSTNTWYHQCIVYTAAAGTVDFYINSAAQTQQTAYKTSINNGSRPFQIGAQFDNTTLSFQVPGHVDDVRIWSRALSSSDVSSIYSDPCNASNGSNLVSQWLFDNDGNDSIGSNNLTNNNSATFTTSSAYACSSPTPASVGIFYWGDQ